MSDLGEDHIVQDEEAEAALCGSYSWESAYLLYGKNVGNATCELCRENAGLLIDPKRVVYEYAAKLVVPKRISLRDMEYIESHIESFLATRYGGEASINAEPKKLDADKTGHEHLLDEG